MKTKNICTEKYAAFSGFTLIELLVVVLIIGILAAVAVPQYQFAVDKSRVSSYLPIISNIANAEQAYYMANGNYTIHFEELDIDLTKTCPILVDNELRNCSGNMALGIAGGTTTVTPQLFYCSNSPCTWNSSSKIITVHFGVQTGSVSNCYVNDDSARGQKLCKWLKPD